MKKFIISENAIKELSNYLVKRPYIEVFELINKIEQDIKEQVDVGESNPPATTELK